ncbi:hypothetical protein GGR55DRAFT_243742 [Xylaria sp. FL0064]|nr:hypothetical protein GGR55DRAFT_243742 [Xylaria sp. FL0064]
MFPCKTISIGSCDNLVSLIRTLVFGLILSVSTKAASRKIRYRQPFWVGYMLPPSLSLYDLAYTPTGAQGILIFFLTVMCLSCGTNSKSLQHIQLPRASKMRLHTSLDALTGRGPGSSRNSC